MLVRMIEKYESPTHLLQPAGREYDLDEGLAQVLIEGGFAEEVKRKKAKVETAEANPHKPERRKSNASDDS